MTQGVTQAAMPGAAHAPSASRHGRRGEQAAGAFDEALGAQKTPHLAETAGMKARADGWRQAGTRAGAGAAALDGAVSKGRPAGKNAVDGTLTFGVAGSPEQPAGNAADETDPAETDADDGLPTQMRAEQTISAIMTIAPIARQAAPPARHGAPKEGEAGASDAEVALAAGARVALEQPSEGHEATSGEEAAAGRGARSERVVADAAAAAISTGSIAADSEAKAPASARAEPAQQAGPQARQADTAEAATDKSAVAAPGWNRPGGSSDGADTRQGGSGGRGAAHETRRGEQIPAAGRVSVIAEQAAPAPAAPSLSANGAAIADAIGADQGWRATAHSSSALLAQAQNSPQPMRELKIQLHPLELGVVTAHLRTVGEKLSVELKVDNHEAYHRLSADSDTIVKSLRSLGFDIDSISVQQPQAAATTVVRSDASAGTGSFSSFQPGNSGSGGERFGGQTSGRGERGDAQGNDAAQPLHHDRAGSSLYI